MSVHRAALKRLKRPGPGQTKTMKGSTFSYAHNNFMRWKLIIYILLSVKYKSQKYSDRVCSATNYELCVWTFVSLVFIYGSHVKTAFGVCEAKCFWLLLLLLLKLYRWIRARKTGDRPNWGWHYEIRWISPGHTSKSKLKTALNQIIAGYYVHLGNHKLATAKVDDGQRRPRLHQFNCTKSHLF